MKFVKKVDGFCSIKFVKKTPTNLKFTAVFHWSRVIN